MIATVLLAIFVCATLILIVLPATGVLDNVWYAGAVFSAFAVFVTSGYMHVKSIDAKDNKIAEQNTAAFKAKHAGLVADSAATEAAKPAAAKPATEAATAESATKPAGLATAPPLDRNAATPTNGVAGGVAGMGEEPTFT